MSQLQLPFFPARCGTEITAAVGLRRGRRPRHLLPSARWPVFVHAQTDVGFISDDHRRQFCVNGNAKQSEIARAFGIPKVTVKRAVKGYREAGPKGFYQQRQTRGAAVLTSAVLVEAQQLLDAGSGDQRRRGSPGDQAGYLVESGAGRPLVGAG